MILLCQLTSFRPDATFAGPQSLGINAIKVQADGTILIGTSSSPPIYRLNNNGSIDTSFDLGSGTDNAVRDVAVQSDGKIIIAGYFSTIDGTSRNGIARLLSNGVPLTR